MITIWRRLWSRLNFSNELEKKKWRHIVARYCVQSCEWQPMLKLSAIELHEAAASRKRIHLFGFVVNITITRGWCCFAAFKKLKIKYVTTIMHMRMPCQRIVIAFAYSHSKGFSSHSFSCLNILQFDTARTKSLSGECVSGKKIVRNRREVNDIYIRINL